MAKETGMNIRFGNRTEETVRIYFEASRDPAIKDVLPQKAQSVEEAIDDYRKALLPGATSYGRTILADGEYIGDIWCYCIDPNDEPNAMLSYCVFEKSLWNRGIATAAVGLFLKEIFEKFSLSSVGAFTYSNNTASVRVLEKNGFRLIEEFTEDGRESKYFQYDGHLN